MAIVGVEKVEEVCVVAGGGGGGPTCGGQAIVLERRALASLRGGEPLISMELHLEVFTEDSLVLRWCEACRPASCAGLGPS